MAQQFNKDLQKGRRGEAIALRVLAAQYPNYTFEDVANNSTYFHIGDIRITSKATGVKKYIEVKNDTSIGHTGNILCEEHQYFSDHEAIGNIHNTNDFYCVVSEDTRTIFLMDMKILQAHYKEGRPKRFTYATQASDTYLYPLAELDKQGGLIATLTY